MFKRLSPIGISLVLAVGSLFVASATAQAQATGQIVGTVTDAVTGAPLSGVQIFLPGSGLGSLSRANGRFLILNVPAGSLTVETQRIGMSVVTREVTVTAGGSVELNLQLSTVALGLDEIVVTGTAGASRRREIGNSIAQVNVADIPGAPDQISDMLRGTAPGVQISGLGGVLGSGSDIRLRGNTSLSMSNSPLIYIDGIRMRSAPIPQGRSAAQRSSADGGNVNILPLNNINPSDIERIEIIKGAAATTLYGTEASAGVIQVFTKRGSSGAPVWTFEAKQSLNRAIEHGPRNGDVCNNDGSCGRARFPFHRLGPFLSNGHIGNYAASVRGGRQDLQYFASAMFEEGSGILPSDTIAKYSVRGNFTFTPGQDFIIQWNSAYAFQGQRNTTIGGNEAGITHNAYRGIANYVNSEDPIQLARLFDQDIHQEVERFTTGVTISHSPYASLTNRLTVGYDFTMQEVRNIRPFGYILFDAGSVSNDTWTNRLLTLDYVGTLGFDVTETIGSKFSWGAQAISDHTRRLNGYGEGFPGAAAPTVSSSSKLLAYENREKVWNAGFFFQNVFDVSDKYFITAGLRIDGHSSFGSDFGLQAYPKASVSWVVSDEDFYPGTGGLKLRAAWGQSGRAPGAFDATRTWISPGLAGIPALVPANVGNPEIGPEVTTELEFGLDGDWMDGRVSSSVTYYSATTSDALFNVNLPASEGFLSSRAQNVGKINSKGVEVTLQATPIRTRNWSWDLGVNVTKSKSEVLDLGGLAEFRIGRDVWVIEGEPAPVFRGPWVSNPDELAAPIITQAHVYGPTEPTLQVMPFMSFRLPGGITVSGRGEYRGGHLKGERMTNGGVQRGGWQPICWPYYATPYDSREFNFAQPNPATHTTALKDDTPAYWRMTCTGNLTFSSGNFVSATFFRLRSVGATIPVDFAFPDRVTNSVLSLTVTNAYSWINSEWQDMDPDQMGDPDRLVAHPRSQPPNTWGLHAGLRVVF